MSLSLIVEKVDKSQLPFLFGTTLLFEERKKHISASETDFNVAKLNLLPHYYFFQ